MEIKNSNQLFPNYYLVSLSQMNFITRQISYISLETELFMIIIQPYLEKLSDSPA